MRVISLCKSRMLNAALFLTIGILATNCEKDPKPEPVLEDNMTITVENVQEKVNSVTITGKVTREKDVPGEAFAGIEYSTDSNFKDSSKKNVEEGTDGSYSLTLEGLEINTSYSYRPYICKDGKTYEYGQKGNFSTKNIGIEISNVEVTETAITVSGKINDNPGSAKFGIAVSKSEDLGAEGSIDSEITPDVENNFTVTVENLDPSTDYWFGIYYKIGDNQVFEATQKVTTGALTLKIENVTLDGGIIYFHYSATWPTIALSYKDEYFIDYGLKSDFSDATTLSLHMENPKDENGLYIKDNTSKERLRPSSKYYYRSYIKIKEGITNSYTGEITTGKMNVDFVLNSFDANSATFSGEVEFGKWNAYAYYEDITFGVLYSTNSNVDNTTAGVGNLELKMESADWYTRLVLVPDTATDIEPNTKYYYRGYYKIDGNYTLFDVDSFTTPAGAPKVSCEVASYKLIDGKVTFLCDVVWPTENKEAYEIGVEYSMNEDFKDGKRAKLSEDKFNDIENKYTVQNPDILLPSSKYYYRSYVNNGKEVVYDKAGNFTTDKMNLRFSVDSFDETSATFSGVFQEGSWNFADKAITYGVLYSTSESFDASTSGVNDLSMSVDLDWLSNSYILKANTATGLSAGTKYYYRGYYKVNGNYTYFDIDSFTTPAGETASISISSTDIYQGTFKFYFDIVKPETNAEAYTFGMEYSKNSDLSDAVDLPITQYDDLAKKYKLQQKTLLDPSSTYYYRAYVKKNGSIISKVEGSFETANVNYAIVLDSNDETSATFSGALNDMSWNLENNDNISFGVICSESENFDINTSGIKSTELKVVSDFWTMMMSLENSTISGLSSGTKYYYKSYCRVYDKYIYGSNVGSFTTPAGETASISISSTDIYQGTFKFYFDIVKPETNAEAYTFGMEYSKNSDLSDAVDLPITQYDDLAKKYKLQQKTLLDPSSTYYYRAYVKKNGSIISKVEGSFETANVNYAIVLDSNDETSATFSGALNDMSWNLENNDNISFGVICSESENFDINTSGIKSTELKVVSDFWTMMMSLENSTISGLSSGTKYYYKSYCRVYDKYIYSSTVGSFTTK